MRRFSHEDLYRLTRDDNRVVLIDFDGTLCEQKFPYVGDARHDAIELCRDLKRAGYTVLVYSSRTLKVYEQQHRAPGMIDCMETWLLKHDIQIDGILYEDKPICCAYLGDEAWNVSNLAGMRKALGI